MANDISFLMEKYNHYLRLAKESEARSDIDLAKRNYYLAAKQLLLASKESTKEVKRARTDKANRLIKYADGLTIESLRKRSLSKASSASQTGQEDDEKGKVWQCIEAPNVTFDDVVGLKEAKEQIKIATIYPLKYPDKYKIYKKQSGGGVLLYGPPGTGKTMIAKAIANEVKAKFYLVRSSDIVSKWVGESEKNIASLFEAVGKEDRSIVFIDEMDTLFASRGLDIHNDRRVNEFLQQIDGFAGKNPNLLILGSTNKPWSIDSAALRSGRFSTKIYIRLPNKEERKEMIKKNILDLPLASDIDVDRIASVTDNFSGADIFLLCDKAKERALLESFESNNIVKITMQDFLNEVNDIKVHIDVKDIAEYERYAGVSSTSEEKKAEENKKEEEKKHERAKEELIVKRIALPFNPSNLYELEFYLSGNHESIYVEVNGQKVMTKKNIKNYLTNPFKIDKPGVYDVSIFDRTLLITFKIKILAPIEENDLGL